MTKTIFDKNHKIIKALRPLTPPAARTSTPSTPDIIEVEMFGIEHEWWNTFTEDWVTVTYSHYWFSKYSDAEAFLADRLEEIAKAKAKLAE